MKRHERSLFLALLLLATLGGAATAAGAQEAKGRQAWRDQVSQALRLAQGESFEQALREAETALELAGEDPTLQASTRNVLGRIHELAGSPGKAVVEYELALKLFRETGSARGQASVYDNLIRAHGAAARSLAAADGIEKALEYARRTVEVFERAEGRSHPRLASYLDELGRLLESDERLEEAAAVYERALEIRNDVLNPGDARIARSFRNLGRIACLDGDLGAATSLLERAYTMLRRYPETPVLALVRTAEAAGRLRFEQKHPDLARDLYTEAFARFDEGPSDEPSFQLERVLLLAGRATLLREEEPDGSSTLWVAAQKGLAVLLPEIEPPLQVEAVFVDLLRSTRCGRRPRDVDAVFSGYVAERQRRLTALGYFDHDPENDGIAGPETLDAIRGFLAGREGGVLDVEADKELAERARLRELWDANGKELEVVKLVRAEDGWIRFSHQEVRRLSPAEPLLDGLAAKGPRLYVDFPGAAEEIDDSSPAEARALWFVGGPPELRELFFTHDLALTCGMVEEPTLRCRLELESRTWQAVIRGSPAQLEAVYRWPRPGTGRGTSLALQLARIDLGPEPWAEAWIAAGEAGDAEPPLEDRLRLIVRKPPEPASR